ncbi:MAG: hypothetical protein CMP59_07640 [Flavobacteriales bacterium]|nr:hypothetical protein [Flavobacteriales bacterium]
MEWECLFGYICLMGCRSFFVLLALVVSSALFGQSEDNAPWRASFKVGRGFMITHQPQMEYVGNQHLNKLELQAERRLIGSKAWHEDYGFPYAGVSLSYFQFDKSEFFGSGIGLAPYYSFFMAGDEKFGLRLRTAVGVGWIEESFDLEENYKNVAIGSSINLYFSVFLEGHYMFNEKWGIAAGIDFSHFSNTGARQPNLGINLPTVNFGISHQFGKSVSPGKISSEDRDEVSSYKSGERFIKLRYGNGIHDTYPVEGPRFLATAVGVEWGKVLSSKSILSGGLDFFYNPGQRVSMRQDSLYIDGGWENLQIGIAVQHLFQFGNFASGLKAGVYLKKEDPDLQFLYAEFIGQYSINKRFDLFISLKTHFARAEYCLFGINYKILR